MLNLWKEYSTYLLKKRLDIITKNNFKGKYLHYGIREHAMCSIANGISTYGIIPVVSTFLVFISYCLAPIRMAALSNHKVLYIFTHMDGKFFYVKN